MLFYRVGGDSRVASFMLAGANLVVLFIGPSIIGYLPGMNPYIFFFLVMRFARLRRSYQPCAVMVVGALIYILGIDLVKEAVWDTWGRVAL